MKRREFITLAGGAAVAWPLAARAQEDGPVGRVGVLGPSLDRPAMRVAYPFFLADLRKLGFVEGRNLLVEFRPVEESVPAVAALKQKFEPQLKTFHATMVVTRAEEWCVEAETAEEARELLAAGQGHRCHLGERVQFEVESVED